mgnify:CR=1 FL=1
MKKTKEVILNTALALFNKEGLSQVTLRTIANEMGISQGNLTYHYKKREEIIEALYYQLVQNIDDSFQPETVSKSMLKSLFDISFTIMTNFYDYRFIFLDFVQVMRENEKIQAHYIHLSRERVGQFSTRFEVLVKEGLLRAPILENEYQNLYTRLKIMSDFWISSELISTNSLAKESIAVYSEIINQSIFPYLTEKGKAEYYTIVNAST